MVRITKSGCVSALSQVKPMVMRMLDAFEHVPGFASLKKILLVDSEETAAAICSVHLIKGSYQPRECFEIFIFDELLRHMTREEKASHMAPLVEMFKGLLERHPKLASAKSGYCCYNQVVGCTWNFVALYVEVSREDESTSAGELVRFLEYVMLTIPVKLKSLLQRLDPNGVDYLLTCFSDERFHACGIRETNFLMSTAFWDVEMKALLIRHGFKYSYHPGYYGAVCLKPIVNNILHEGPLMVHELLDGGRMEGFIISGNQRKQMALEILDLLLFEDGMNREVLCTLWQSLPDPFITPDELYHLMEPIFLPTPVLVEACVRYRELIPGVPHLKQPRSLKHLARVRIREIMVRAHSIGEKAVRSLGLPKTLEDYLWWLEVF